MSIITNWRYRETLNEIFYNFPTTLEFENSSTNNLFNTYELNKAFLSINTNLESSTLEIPCFQISTVGYLISDGIIHSPSEDENSNYATKLVVPLYVSESYPRRTADSIIRNLFDVHATGLQKVTTNKGEVYLGNRGIILDSNYNILIICTWSFKKGEDNHYYFHKPIVRVNPSVLTSNKIVEKNILKKIIPHYLELESTRCTSSYGFVVSNNVTVQKIQVIIDDEINNFIYKPEITDKFTEEELHQTLIDNIGDIII